MNSLDTRITYREICNRAKGDAMEWMPDLPKENTVEAWEAFVADLEDLDAYEIAHESSGWDWVIYYHRAMELCQAVPTSVLHEAEAQFEDMGGFGDAPVGLYEMACQLASIIVSNEIAQAVEQAREELLEMAQTQLENL